MAIANIDKCPVCGTPYMSALKPGEDPHSRYCYTCETTSGGAQFAAQLQAAGSGPRDAVDDLTLIPNEGDGQPGGPRPGRMAPGKRPINFKPAGRTSGKLPAVHGPGSRPAMPAVTGSRAAMPAVTGSRAAMPAVSGSRAAMPAVAPSGSRAAIPAVAASGSRAAIPAITQAPQAPVAYAPPQPVTAPAQQYVAPQSAPVPPTAVAAPTRERPAAAEAALAMVPAASQNLRPESASALNMPGSDIELETLPEDEPPPPPPPAPVYAQPAAPAPVVQPMVMPVAEAPLVVAPPPAARASAAGLPATRASGTNLPAASPRQGSAANIQPARRNSAVGMPAASGTSARMKAVPGGKTSATMAAVTTPASRSSARQKAVAADPKKNLIIYGVAGVVGLIVLVLIFKSSGSKPAPVAENEAAKPAAKSDATLRMADASTAKPAATAKPAEPKPEETKKAEPRKEEPKKEEPAAAQETPPPAVPVAENKPANNVADALELTTTRKSANAKVDDDEPDAAVAVKKPVEKKPEPAKTAAPQPPANAAAQGDDGEAPKKPVDTMVALGIKKKEPEKEEKAPPKPGSEPVTATEPIFVPIDFSKLAATPETTSSQSINTMFPGWRARDFNTDFTQTTTYDVKGRKNVLMVNPMNDVLPAKLLSTIEIPASFASKRPVLLFELSVKDFAKPMFVSVKIMNIEAISKTPIRVSKDLPWVDLGVPLHALAGKRAEVSIEFLMPPRTKADKMKEHIACIRNLRLEWAGKK